MRLAIVGTRTYDNFKYLEKQIISLVDIEDIDEIISGGASGVDSLAEIFATKYSKPITIFKPNWNTYGKKAGFLRNKEIIDRCDKCICFWDGTSKGTKISIDLAIKQNKLLTIVEI